jgi:hypothetical protein
MIIKRHEGPLLSGSWSPLHRGKPGTEFPYDQIALSVGDGLLVEEHLLVDDPSLFVRFYSL